MKLTKTVIKENPDYAKLVRAVVSNVGYDSIQDINNHGISGGFGGFIYYSDTVKFFNSHKKDILSMAENMAADLGEGMLEMIQNFNCLKNGKIPDYTVDEIAQALYAGRGDCVEQIKNAMAWFAAEEVCRMFDD